MKLIPVLALGVLVSGIGCQSATTPKEPVNSENERASSATRDENELKPVGGEAEPARKIAEKKLEIPAALRTSAVQYLGLDVPGMRTFIIKTGGQPEQEGQVRTSVQSVSGNEVLVSRENLGALAQTGTENLSIRKDGVFVKSISEGSLNKEQMELPGDLKVGSTWKQVMKIEMNGNSIEQNASLKAIKIEKTTVPAGVYEALKVELAGTIKSANMSGQMNANLWYAKGVGLVKIVTTLKPQGGTSTVEQSMELKSLDKS